MTTTKHNDLYCGDVIRRIKDHNTNPPKKPYPIAKTNIKPCDNKQLFEPLESKLSKYDVEIEYLNSVVSVKFKTGKIYRNIMWLRHPKVKDNKVYFNLFFNCITDESDLNRIGLTSHFTFKKHGKLFNVPAVELSNLVDIITDYLVSELCIIANRRQKAFNNKCNR